MSKQQSIREALAIQIAVGDGAQGWNPTPEDYMLADQILASPVIRRIQADAIWDVRMKLNEHLLQRHGASHVDYALELLHNEATRLRSE